jgi:hypothetical protein
MLGSLVNRVTLYFSYSSFDSRPQKQTIQFFDSGKRNKKKSKDGKNDGPTKLPHQRNALTHMDYCPSSQSASRGIGGIAQRQQ